MNVLSLAKSHRFCKTALVLTCPCYPCWVKEVFPEKAVREHAKAMNEKKWGGGERGQTNAVASCDASRGLSETQFHSWQFVERLRCLVPGKGHEVFFENWSPCFIATQRLRQRRARQVWGSQFRASWQHCVRELWTKGLKVQFTSLSRQEWRESLCFKAASLSRKIFLGGRGGERVYKS